jgi:hypothetical protein
MQHNGIQSEGRIAKKREKAKTKKTIYDRATKRQSRNQSGN